MVSRISGSNLSRTQKLYAVESIKSAILFGNDEEKNRKVEKVLDEIVDLGSQNDRDAISKETQENDDSLLYNSVYNATSSSEFFELLFTPGDENVGDIRINLQNYSLQSSLGRPSSLQDSSAAKIDDAIRETYYEMSNYFFVSTEGLHINQYI